MANEMKLHFPELNDGLMFIPRRKRSPSSEKKLSPTMSTLEELEAAAILMAMAYSVPNVDAFCNYKLQKFHAPTMKKQRMKKQGKKKQRKKKKKNQNEEFPSITDMPAAMRERIGDMGGYEIHLVIQKQLQDTDLNKNHGRLSLPTKQLIFDFATEEERNLLSQLDDKKKKVGMNVVILDSVLRESVMCLKKWRIGSDDVYCLMTHWNSFVEENGLKSGEFIQLWCFRRDEFQPQTQTIIASRLCFAMLRL